jgi:hypothetical protein
VGVELSLAVYALITLLVALQTYTPLVPMLALFTLGFGYVGLLGLWQGLPPASPQVKTEELPNVNISRKPSH